MLAGINNEVTFFSNIKNLKNNKNKLDISMYTIGFCKLKKKHTHNPNALNKYLNLNDNLILLISNLGNLQKITYAKLLTNM